MADFSHYSPEGRSRMVDTSGKQVSSRLARAIGFVYMRSETMDMIEKHLLPKGDLFEVARIAGIMAGKSTSNLIPMCHTLQINFIDVQVALDRQEGGIRIESEVRVEGRTGAEMEALTAVTTAALTVYDMCKAVDTAMEIRGVRLIEKRGGKTDLIT